MEEFRSNSYSDGRNYQLERYDYGSKTYSNPNPVGLQDLRCYSASYASSSAANNAQMEMPKDVKFKKGKSTNGSISKSWSFSDPELQRKKRVASYKVYAVEGKVKGSFKKSFRWIKERYTKVVYGWR
ncbi:OLC1v1037756C1 [Oldenlandia corymbosa var. corymbosa]|uniref:OLC1v1037756C1 n=1 Tax=Oldenlandia corymbosa var. corymbosa TaxID=529605 RepID=A0AAV1CZH3_OLDCO|nr:OLC1v1037756C1 [Oldenlandia corymbosa var. corymbosa]